MLFPVWFGSYLTCCSHAAFVPVGDGGTISLSARLCEALSVDLVLSVGPCGCWFPVFPPCPVATVCSKWRPAGAGSRSGPVRSGLRPASRCVVPADLLPPQKYDVLRLHRNKSPRSQTSRPCSQTLLKRHQHKPRPMDYPVRRFHESLFPEASRCQTSEPVLM